MIRRIHLDTDLGGDMDDLRALAMLLRWPAVEIAGITTVAEADGRRAGYVRRVLEMEERPDIPLAAGADVSQGYYRYPELAAVLGHEIGHVVARHSAEQVAKARLTEGLTGAVVIASYDPDNPSSMRTGQVAALIGQLVNMRFGREDELESDFFGVCFIKDAGYDPVELISG